MKKRSEAEKEQVSIHKFGVGSLLAKVGKKDTKFSSYKAITGSG